MEEMIDRNIRLALDAEDWELAAEMAHLMRFGLRYTYDQMLGRVRGLGLDPNDWEYLMQEADEQEEK